VLINYIITAEVVDVRKDSPNSADTFLVDSNVWYWLTYTKASLVDGYGAKRRTIDYSSFLNKAIAQRAQLCRCGLSMAELAHIIERSERTIFSKTHGPTETKEFRHNYPTERSNVISEIQTAWGQVKSMASSLDILIDSSLTDVAMNRFSKSTLDGYDIFFLEVMTNNKVPQIITDDGGFATVPGIRVFTANQTVITAAQGQGKLLTR
jgi:predicted nucleic acid-binding protein